MGNTFFDVYDVKQLAAAAKKNNVEITINWYEDHGFITIHPILEIDDEPEPSEAQKLYEEVISNYANSKTDAEPEPPEEHKLKETKQCHITDDEATMKRVISEICSIEFDSETQADAILSSMHYMLDFYGSVTSDNLYDQLDCRTINYDFKTDDEDDARIVWTREDCGMENGDFLEVKIIKKANGKYSYDSFNFPKPSYCVYRK